MGEKKRGVGQNCEFFQTISVLIFLENYLFDIFSIFPFSAIFGAKEGRVPLAKIFIQDFLKHKKNIF